jgi:hypothetical protein
LSIYGVPLQAKSQVLSITLSGVVYTLSVQYRNGLGWILDIADSQGNAIVCGIPLITGADLLAQYDYLGFTGSLWVQTTSDPDAVPTFANLGTDGLLYYVA